MASERIALKRSAVRQRIVKAALKAFTDCGYDKTTTVQIADAVGMTGPALYHYFPTKDALLYACIDDLMAELVDALDSAGRIEGTPLDRLANVVRTQVVHELRVAAAGPVINAHLYGPGYLTDVLSQDQRDRLKTIQKRVVDAYRSPIVAAIADGRIAPVDATVAAFNALAIVQYTAVWFRRGRRHKVADIADEQARAVLLMLGASLPATLARQVG